MKDRHISKSEMKDLLNKLNSENMDLKKKEDFFRFCNNHHISIGQLNMIITFRNILNEEYEDTPDLSNYNTN